MTRVLTPLDVRYIDGENWLVMQPFSVYTARLGRIDVPAGRLTDFNSVPKPLWNILPPTECGEAAVVHDELYRRGEIVGVRISRADADEVHRELVAWVGSADDPSDRSPVRLWKRRAFDRGLRLFGWVTWRRYRASAREV